MNFHTTQTQNSTQPSKSFQIYSKKIHIPHIKFILLNLCVYIAILILHLNAIRRYCTQKTIVFHVAYLNLFYYAHSPFSEHRFCAFCKVFFCILCHFHINK